MNKFNSKIIYQGNLMLSKEEGNSLVKENVWLIYDEDRDVFYSFIDTFNLFLSRDLDKLSSKALEENRKLIDKYTYRHAYSGGVGEVYVDESSISILITDKEDIDKVSKERK